jgi:F-type H+-transporting ATPase subunit delta
VRGETIARNYAAALFELGARDGVAESYGIALGEIAALVRETPGIRRLLDTPRIPLTEKKALLRNALEGRVPTHLMNFLFLLLDKRRHRLIPEIADEYRALLDHALGRAHVEVRVARDIGEEERGELAAQLSRILGKTAIPHVRVRPELLGGVVFRSGDMIFDGSVRRRLHRMRRQLMSTEVSSS